MGSVESRDGLQSQAIEMTHIRIELFGLDTVYEIARTRWAREDPTSYTHALTHTGMEFGDDTNPLRRQLLDAHVYYRAVTQMMHDIVAWEQAPSEDIAGSTR